LPIWKEFELGEGWTKVSLEQIAAWNADQIYLISYTGNPQEIVAELYTDSQWLALKAVQDKSLYAFPKDYYSWDQPDPRWILGLSWLAWRMHPQETGEFDTILSAREFFNRWYGIDQATFDQYLLPRLQGSLE
jgi:iron complex transport system substrate-binding protein